MIFHENRENVMPYFCRTLGKMSQNLSSAAVVIGALRVIESLGLKKTLCIFKKTL